LVGPIIILEHCVNGQLNDYLQTNKSSITEESQDLIRFGLGVARGMEYLAGKRIVHRRLAARNVLLDDALEVKIAGFGPMKVDNSKPERIPIKWVAPECLQTTKDATEKSDVWSYGVVLWEIFSVGDAPYDNIRGKDIPGLINSDYKLAKPDNCNDQWYDVMKRCWQTDPNGRPTFKVIKDTLDNIYVAASKDEYYYCAQNII
ncbi:RON-like protein, partial [Mya arenaria]